MAKRTAEIQSMTGYGRAMRQTAIGRVTVELRSTNHRYLEIDQRLPNGLAALQGRVSELIRNRIGRGRIDALVSLRSDRGGQRRINLDNALLERYYRALLDLKGRFGLKGAVTMEQLLALPQAVSITEELPSAEELWSPIRTAAETALRELVRMRRREGTRLVADIKRQLGAIARHARAIKVRLPIALARQKRYLRRKLRELLGSGAPHASAQLEGAVSLIKEVDVNEELVRLESHVAHMYQVLRGRRPAGKQLDFLAQELTREANTLGSKVNDAHAARYVVDVKACIERIREQAQNIE